MGVGESRSMVTGVDTEGEESGSSGRPVAVDIGARDPCGGEDELDDIS